MKDDKLIQMGFDGLTPEVVEMSDQERMEVGRNQQIKEGLLKLKSAVPEPQIHFARVKQAIESEGVTPQRRGFPLWPALSGIAAASLAAAAYFIFAPGVDSERNIAAQNPTEEPVQVAMADPVQEEIQTLEGAETTSESELAFEEPIVLAQANPSDESATRSAEAPRSRPRARSESQGGMTTASSTQSNSAAESVVSNVAEIVSNRRQDEARRAEVPLTATHIDSESIIVVQTGFDPTTGSVPATEVRSPHDVVLGG